MQPMHEVTIRRARIAERGSLEAIQWRASLNNSADREALLAHPDAIELPAQQIEDGLVFVAESSGASVGFAAILSRPDGDTELDALFVEPAVWRNGVGRALVERCASEARADGATELHVVGNPHARAFYAACGFREVGTTETRFGVGLVLRRDLGCNKR